MIDTFGEMMERKNRMRWTKERIEALQELHKQGWNAKEIAAEMGVTVDAIRHRLKRLEKGA